MGRSGGSRVETGLQVRAQYTQAPTTGLFIDPSTVNLTHAET